MESADQTWFEPRTFGQIISSGLRACFANGAAVYIMMAAVLLPMAIVSVLNGYIASELGVYQLQAAQRSGTLNPAQIDWKSLIIYYVFLAGLMAVSIASVYFATAGGAKMIAEQALGNKMGPAAGWDALLGSFFKNLGGAVVQGAVVVLALIFLGGPAAIVGGIATAALMGGPAAAAGGSPGLLSVIPAVAAAVPLLIIGAYLVAMPSVTGVEPRGAFATVGRSFSLTSGNFFRVVGVVLVTGLVLAGPMVGAGMLGQKVMMPGLSDSIGESWAGLVAATPQALLSVFLSPLMYAIQVALYFDLRSRKKMTEDFTPADLAFDLGHDVTGVAPDSPLEAYASDGAPVVAPPTEATPSSSDDSGSMP